MGIRGHPNEKSIWLIFRKESEVHNENECKNNYYSNS